VSRTAFVSFGGDGFWVYDVAQSIFLKHLIDVAEPRANYPDAGWLREAIAWWRVVAGPGQGTYGFQIEQSWSATQRALFVELARQACDLMAKRTTWSGEEISSWPIHDDDRIFTRGAEFIATAPVIELGNAVIGLAECTLPEAPQGTWWFFGTPKGKDTIRKREEA